MAITTITPPKTTDLTTLDAVREELKLTIRDHDALLARYLRSTTAAAEGFCNRLFCRASYTELLAGYGSPLLELEHVPIVLIAAVLDDGEALTDYVIHDAAEGVVYREKTWRWTAIQGRVAGSLSGNVQLPGTEKQDFSFTYTSGFLLPGDNYIATTISAAASDNSLNDSAGGFPALAPGDFLETEGLIEGVYHKMAVSTATASKIVITSDTTLVDEAAGERVELKVRNLPADVEEAAIVTVKAWYQRWNAERDESVVSKRVADMAMQFKRPGEDEGDLPPRARALLRPWMRMAA